MKTVIITGANSGLGFETARKIAKDLQYRVILACRNEQKALAAQTLIINETHNRNIIPMKLDTSSFTSVRTFVENIEQDNREIDVLINNAGISSAHSGVTEDGFDLVFATNYLGHFLLTNLLLPVMSKTARILNVSSDMHDPPGGIEWKGVEYLAHPTENDRRKYSYSKLCNLYFTYELDRKLMAAGSDITVNAFNPGFMADTNFFGGAGKLRAATVKVTMPDRYGNLKDSSNALVLLAVYGKFAKVSGKYFDRSTTIKDSSPLSYDRKNAEELWRKSEEYTALNKDEL